MTLIKTASLKLMPLIFSAEEQLLEVLVHAPGDDSIENEYGYSKNDDGSDDDDDDDDDGDDEYIHLQGKNR